MSSKTVSLTLQIPASELPALLAMAAKSGVSIATSGGKMKKVKKEKDPNAPKKDSNDWIRFTQRARSILLAGGCELKGFVGQQYCAMLKEHLPQHSVTDAKGKEKQVPDYDSISDADILSRFKSWTPPEQSIAAAARTSKANSEAASSDAESVSSEHEAASGATNAAASSTAAAAAPPAEAKPKRKWSDAAKAAAAEKRALKKAGGETVAVIPPKPTGPKPSAVAAAPAPTPVAEGGDITEFAPTTIGGVKYMRNCRGDILSLEYDWIGRLEKDGKTINKKLAKPADLDE